MRGARDTQLSRVIVCGGDRVSVLRGWLVCLALVCACVCALRVCTLVCLFRGLFAFGGMS